MQSQKITLVRMSELASRWVGATIGATWEPNPLTRVNCRCCESLLDAEPAESAMFVEDGAINMNCDRVIEVESNPYGKHWPFFDTSAEILHRQIEGHVQRDWRCRALQVGTLEWRFPFWGSSSVNSGHVKQCGASETWNLNRASSSGPGISTLWYTVLRRLG